MCGACGSPAGGWSTFLVSGSRRRQDIARLYTKAARGTRVRAWQEGWVLSRPTGQDRVVHGLPDLALALAERTVLTTPDDVVHLLQEDEGLPQPYDDPYEDLVPALEQSDSSWDVTFACMPGQRLHLRLAAILLGRHLVRPGDTAALVVHGRREPFTLLCRPDASFALGSAPHGRCGDGPVDARRAVVDAIPTGATAAAAV